MEFDYQVKNQVGQINAGRIEAPDENAAVSILHERGYVVLSLKAVPKDLFSVDVAESLIKPGTKDIVAFTRQLSTLIEADMPLVEGLTILAKQSEKGAMRKVVTDISTSVENGSSLSAALAEHPDLFSTFYIKLVQAGEVSGKLQSSLLYLADYLEHSQSINSKIKGALAYPAFVVSALIIVTLIMTIYVLPQLLSIFKDSGITNLPLTTRILIAVTDFFNKYLYYIATLLVAGIFLLVRYVKTPDGKAWRDNFLINMPSLGIIVRNLYLARMAESLSTLIKAGISILDAIKITGELVGNENYRRIMVLAEDQVRSGGTMSEVMGRFTEITPLFTSMVAVGERTGKLDYMLEHIAKFYKSESENAVNSITQLIEPVLVLVLGAGVAILVSSILLPIYSLVGGN